MPNAIQIEHDGVGARTFKLQASRIIITHEKSPIAAALPGISPLLFDLGQWRVFVNIEGVTSFPGTNLTDAGINIADKDDIEDMANPTITNPWHGRTILITDATASPSSVYTVKLSKVELTKIDAQNVYTFSIQAIGRKNP